MPAENADRRKQYSKRKKGGLCPRCGGKVKKSSPYINCDDCREYYRNYNRDFSESTQEARRERYAQRKAEKRCPRCGVFLGKKSDSIICPACLKRQYKYNTGKTKPKKRVK
ncbi:MAG: hypothetical protein FWB83_05320 [Treponema sp.]|nr:hypothetical protein [Treponema sp.]